MVARGSLLFAGLLLGATSACNSTSVNETGSGGQAATGGSGGSAGSAAGGAAGAPSGGASGSGGGDAGGGGAAGSGGAVQSSCADSDGGLLGADGKFEGSLGQWFSGETIVLSSDAACGAQALELSGTTYSQIRHHFTPAAGKYTVSFCAKALSPNLKLLVAHIPPPNGSSQEVLMNDTALPAGQWTHFVVPAVNVPASDQYTIVIAVDDQDGPDVLIDCASIEPAP